VVVVTKVKVDARLDRLLAPPARHALTSVDGCCQSGALSLVG
jgi:hypothetical protein